METVFIKKNFFFQFVIYVGNIVFKYAISSKACITKIKKQKEM